MKKVFLFSICLMLLVFCAFGLVGCKDNPDYTLPTNLTATYGQTLADIALPTGFTWESAGTTSVGNVGTNSFTVKYTPADTENYNTVGGIRVNVVV